MGKLELSLLPWTLASPLPESSYLVEETLWTCWIASTLDCTAAFRLPNFHGPAMTHVDVAVEHGLKVIRNDLGYLINQAHQEAAHSVVSRHFSRLSTKQRLGEALLGTTMSPAGPQAVSLPYPPTPSYQHILSILQHSA